MEFWLQAESEIRPNGKCEAIALTPRCVP
ncbi:hypothetical protein GWE18_34880 [Bradyrhizobium sp. CSA112]|nr:hypothetical protein [Bradyrhizobium sp. CSA112]